MESTDQVGGAREDVVERFPGPVCWAPAHPVYQVFDGRPSFGVQNGVHVCVSLAINQGERGRRDVTIRDGGNYVGFQQRHMEHRVKLNVWWQVETKNDRVNLSRDAEWADLTEVKLLQGRDVLRLVVRSQTMSPILKGWSMRFLLVWDIMEALACSNRMCVARKRSFASEARSLASGKVESRDGWLVRKFARGW
jgi:hypothetical protein